MFKYGLTASIVLGGVCFFSACWTMPPTSFFDGVVMAAVSGAAGIFAATALGLGNNTGY